MDTPFICTPKWHEDSSKYLDMNPKSFRQIVRQGLWKKPTSGCCSGYTQLNLVILPEILAADFKLFCEKNPKPCPLLEIVPKGEVEVRHLAPGSDLRSDLPGYRLFRGRQITELDDIKSAWRDDFVSFLIGCSFTFESALLKNNIPVRHVELNRNVPMFVTNIDCKPAGPFYGKMVVSMRPIPEEMVEDAINITSCYPDVHGGPIHFGDPAVLGIKNLDNPDYGEQVPVKEGEIPVFWACGVTPQVALMNVAPEIAITHAPGLMFISDYRDNDFYVDQND